VKILLIITPFYPAQTPNTIRWDAIIHEFINNGYEVTVLTTKWTKKEPFEEINGIKIYRAGHHTLLDFLWNKLGVNKRRNVSSFAKIKKSNFIVAKIERIVDRIWRKRYWPDGSVLFFEPGKKVINKIIREDSITHVISVGLPFTCHLIAKQAKKNSPRLHWTMDVQDPFSISDAFWVNNFSKYALRNIEAEQECLNAADEIVFTNTKVTELYKELFGERSKNYSVIPPLFVMPQELNNESNQAEVGLILEEGKKHIAYFGSFYEGVRSPFRFLQFLDVLFKNYKASLFKMQFHFYGELNKFSKPIFLLFDHLSPYIQHHGFISHDKLTHYISKYDILLNFGNTTNYHLPSKVVEFLYYNKPVINIVSIDDDSAKVFLKNKMDIFNIKLSSDISKDDAESFISYVLQEQEKRDVSLKNVEEFLPKEISNLYLDLMKSV